MALFGALSSLRTQLADPTRFAPALAFLDDCRRPGTAAHTRLAAITPGQTERIDLPNGAFGLLQAYQTKDRSENRLETHLRYVDVQAVVSGEEIMELVERGKLVVSEDFSEPRDAIFYHPFEAGSLLRMDPGVVAVFFPTDAHRGGIAIGQPALVRKVVVKVPLAT